MSSTASPTSTAMIGSIVAATALVVAACSGGGGGGGGGGGVVRAVEAPPAEPEEVVAPVPAEESADSEPVASLAPGLHELSVVVGADERRYELHVPELGHGAPRPLVLAFHSWGQTPKEVVAGPWRDLADANGFLLAAPAAIEGEWAVAQTEAEAAAAVEHSVASLESFPIGGRDAALAEVVLDDVASRVRVDSTRVYVTGDSLGGWMASRVACELGDRLAALGPTVNAVLYSDPCATAAPISVISVGHTSDSTHSILDARTAIDAWATHNGCSFPPSEGEVVAADGVARVHEVTFSGCGANTRVRLLAQVTGSSLDELQAVWDFFADSTAATG